VEGVQGVAGVPVVGRGDHDGVDVRTGQEVAVIVMDILFGESDVVLGALFPAGVDVADRDNLDVGLLGLSPDKLPDVPESHAADADHADVDAIIGADYARRRGPRGAGRQALRQGNRRYSGRRVPKKVATRTIHKDLLTPQRM